MAILPWLILNEMIIMDRLRSRQELQEKLGLRDREHFRKQYLKPALEAGLISMSNPDKPRAADQKYSMTELGKSVIAGDGFFYIL